MKCAQKCITRQGGSLINLLAGKNLASLKQTDFTIKVALAAYCLSSVSPVFSTEEVASIELERSAEPWPIWCGIFVLLLGWTAAIEGPKHNQYWSIAWLANPLFFVAVARHRRRSLSSVVISLIGFIIVLTSFFLRKMWSDKEPPSVFTTAYGLVFLSMAHRIRSRRPCSMENQECIAVVK